MKQQLQISKVNNETELVAFRDAMKGILKEGVAEVTFTKKDGDQRIMTCTLDNTLLPVVEVVEGVEPKTPRVLKNPNNTLSVYDINAKGWRSFVVENVTAVTYEV
tara:strand:+ start:336 stop:650 length:315 start_codon:yes stop_codon:yes gene_type:complete